VDRDQRTVDRGQRSEVGDLRSEIGGQKRGLAPQYDLPEADKSAGPTG